MSAPLLVLRPEPGAAATAMRAAARGLVAIVAPLFTVEPVPWQSPDADAFDAVLLTSANAVRHAGAGLAAYRHLPAHAVGEATAQAAREAGFTTLMVGEADGAALLARAGDAGVERLLHICGRDHRPLEDGRIAIERRIVYASLAAERLPDAAQAALTTGAVALLHSPRAAALFRRLLKAAGLDPAGTSIAAISPAAMAAAGGGWAAQATAGWPTDDALLAAAARLCD